MEMKQQIFVECFSYLGQTKQAYYIVQKDQNFQKLRNQVRKRSHMPGNLSHQFMMRVGGTKKKVENLTKPMQVVFFLKRHLVIQQYSTGLLSRF